MNSNGARARLEGLLETAKRERDALPKADIRDDPYAYGVHMHAGGRVVGIVEALQCLDDTPTEGA